MSARSLLRHVFRHGPRKTVSEDALPLGIGHEAPGADRDTKRLTATPKSNECTKIETFTSRSKTPEPFGLEDIAGEALIDTVSSIDTASLMESLASLNLEISSFSTRELFYATLDEAKAAARSHLDTINTTLALLEALEGFSATISELRREMQGKKEECEEKLATLDAVERAIEGLIFAGEVQE